MKMRDKMAKGWPYYFHFVKLIYPAAGGRREVMAGMRHFVRREMVYAAAMPSHYG